MTTDNPVTLDETEREAMDALLRFFNIVREWGASCDNVDNELVPAIHVCQSFVIQRMLSRLNPENFASWYTE